MPEVEQELLSPALCQNMHLTLMPAMVDVSVGAPDPLSITEDQDWATHLLSRCCILHRIACKPAASACCLSATGADLLRPRLWLQACTKRLFCLLRQNVNSRLDGKQPENRKMGCRLNVAMGDLTFVPLNKLHNEHKIIPASQGAEDNASGDHVRDLPSLCSLSICRASWIT